MHELANPDLVLGTAKFLRSKGRKIINEISLNSSFQRNLEEFNVCLLIKFQFNIEQAHFLGDLRLLSVLTVPILAGNDGY